MRAGLRAAACRAAMMMALGAVTALLAVSPAFAGPLASDWVEGHNVRTRLIAGSAAAPSHFVAGLEMELADGWKTYWRTPGDAGGVPPEFDWSGSTNVAEIHVSYPAPMRMTDRAGNTIGYKKHVVFPVYVLPEKADQPVTLKLQFTFGVCHDICVPSEGTYDITIPASNRLPAPAALTEAMKRVPVIETSDGNARIDGGPDEVANAPRLAKVATSLGSPSPTVTMHVTFPKGIAGADVFVEGPAGEFVPLPANKGLAGENTLIFEIDLTQGADVAALKGKELRATIVSDGAQSEKSFVLE
jgi:DsbC/DsbD-like thiol-disulfide interchange protein